MLPLNRTLHICAAGGFWSILNGNVLIWFAVQLTVLSDLQRKLWLGREFLVLNLYVKES